MSIGSDLLGTDKKPERTQPKIKNKNSFFESDNDDDDLPTHNKNNKKLGDLIGAHNNKLEIHPSVNLKDSHFSVDSGINVNFDGVMNKKVIFSFIFIFREITMPKVLHSEWMIVSL